MQGGLPGQRLLLQVLHGQRGEGLVPLWDGLQSGHGNEGVFLCQGWSGDRMKQLPTTILTIFFFSPQGRCLEFGDDGTPLYVPFVTDENEIHHLFKRSLILNSTGRVIGSIDQKYLEQIVQEFNKTINSNLGRSTTPQSSENLVNFEHPIDIPGQDLDELTTQVFQYDPPDWEISDEFLADVDVVYLEKDISSSIAILAQIYSTFLLSICTFVVFLL